MNFTENSFTKQCQSLPLFGNELPHPKELQQEFSDATDDSPATITPQKKPAGLSASFTNVEVSSKISEPQQEQGINSTIPQAQEPKDENMNIGTQDKNEHPSG